MIGDFHPQEGLHLSQVGWLDETLVEARFQGFLPGPFLTLRGDCHEQR